jgi:hypothetical protein
MLFWKIIIAYCENIVTQTILSVGKIQNFEMLNQTERIAKIAEMAKNSM